jgi:hypothetical protein
LVLKLQHTAGAPEVAQKLAKPLDRHARLSRDNKAVCGCALAALAAERYRRKRDHWPAALADLVADRFLDEVPADPYDGKPLRLRQTRDGIVVYSIGPDGAGKGDALDNTAAGAKEDRLEFRLWDAARR